jgi:hypothetical protein
MKKRIVLEAVNTILPFKASYRKPTHKNTKKEYPSRAYLIKLNFARRF